MTDFFFLILAGILCWQLLLSARVLRELERRAEEARREYWEAKVSKVIKENLSGIASKK